MFATGIAKLSAKRLALTFILGAALLLGGIAEAYEVGPIRLVLVPNQGQRSASISINNTDATPLRVEIKALRRLVAEDGTQTFKPADDDFVIFPPQAEVAPGKSQSIRFQYIGPPVSDLSAAYVIQVVQLPVVDPAFSGVRFTYNFGVAVYLDPPRAKEKLELVSAERTATGLRLRVRNEGTSYGLLTNRRIVANSAGNPVNLDPAQLGARVSNPLVPPKSERLFEIAVPEWANVPQAPASAKLANVNG